MRPVLKGMCRMESLFDGTIDLWQLALMNQAIDCDLENQWRMTEAAKKEKR